MGDHDWIRVNLVAGQAITVTLNGVTLVDPYLRIHDSTGAIIHENDDINTGVNLNSSLSFAAPTTGVYYIDVGAYNDARRRRLPGHRHDLDPASDLQQRPDRDAAYERILGRRNPRVHA